MIKSCHTSKISVHVLLLLIFDTNNTCYGMQCKNRFLKRKVISKTIEEFQGMILLKRKLSVKARNSFAKCLRCQIMARPVRESYGLQSTPNFYFMSRYVRCWRAILKCKVCEFKLEINKCRSKLKKP